MKDQLKIIISKKIKRKINRVLLKNTLNSYFLWRHILNSYSDWKSKENYSYLHLLFLKNASNKYQVYRDFLVILEILYNDVIFSAVV